MSLNEKSVAYGAQKSSIREISAYAGERKAQIGAENVFDFSLGNPSIPAPDAVRASIEKSLTLPATQLHGYTPASGLPAAREAVAASLCRRFGEGVASAGDLYLTCGAAASLSISFHSVVDPGDEVIVIAPYFPEYRVWIETSGAACVEVLADPTTFQVDVAAVAAAITPRTKAVVINSPNNPTGRLLSAASLDAVARVAAEFGLYVVSDDVYCRLVFDGECERFAARHPELRAQTVVAESFSKPWAMTGWRMGWIACAEPLMSQIAKAHQAAASSSVAFCMEAAERALAIDPAPMLETYRRRRDRVVAALDAMGLPVARPQGAFYAFPSIEGTGMGDEEFCERAVSEAGVGLVPGSSFGAPGHVRLSFCVSDGELDLALERLAAFVS